MGRTSPQGRSAVARTVPGGQKGGHIVHNHHIVRSVICISDRQVILIGGIDLSCTPNVVWDEKCLLNVCFIKVVTD